MIEDDTLLLNHASLASIPDIPPHIMQVILFRNHIKLITPLPSQIVYLDLSDNKISTIENLENLVNLKVLDLSYNLIENIVGLSNLKVLEELYLNCNSIMKIENIDLKVKKLDLSCNEIKKIENLMHLVTIEELYMANNTISKVDGISSLVNLKVLGLQNNTFVDLDCLNLPKSIETLLLNECGDLKSIRNLDYLINLKSIDITKTLIDELDLPSHIEVFYK